MKPILVYCQPRKIPIIERHYNRIKGIDKLNIRFYSAPDVYKFLKGFLKEFTYDWILLYTNDTLIKQFNVDTTLKNIKTGGFEVIAGVMNVDMYNMKNYWAATENLPSLDISQRYYRFIEKGTRNGIIPVKFVGKSLLAIHRTVLEDFDWGYDKHNNGSNDLYFAHHCDAKGVRIYANTDNNMVHLRGFGTDLVGKEKPSIVYAKSEGHSYSKETLAFTPT